jgi:hypothetical protein
VPRPVVPAGGRGRGAPNTALPGPEATAGRGELDLIDFAYGKYIFLFFAQYGSNLYLWFSLTFAPVPQYLIFFCDERFCFSDKNFLQNITIFFSRKLLHNYWRQFITILKHKRTSVADFFFNADPDPAPRIRIPLQKMMKIRIHNIDYSVATNKNFKCRVLGIIYPDPTIKFSWTCPFY